MNRWNVLLDILINTIKFPEESIAISIRPASIPTALSEIDPVPMPMPIESTPKLLKRFTSETTEKESSMHLIGAEAYALLARNRKKHGTQLMAILMEDIDRELLFHENVRIAALEISTVDKAEAARKETEAKLPADYHDFLDVFDRSKADKLSSHRECDYKIELNEGQGSPPKSKAYKMLPFKLIKIKEYLTKMLSKRFITPSKVLYFSPILFALKSNRDLRFCVDYRKLNALTKRNRYPLFLIDEIIGKLRDCKFLSRLDIIAAFNKIRMHEDSEDLTTFITALGQYKYRVLPFGLTNGPSIFQQYINEVL